MRTTAIPFRAAAWLPAPDGDQGDVTAAGCDTDLDRAIDWIELQRAHENLNPLLITPRRDVSSSRALRRFADRYEHLTRSSGTRSAHRRPVLLVSPDAELLALASSWGQEHAVCVVGGTAADSRGWAWAVGAEDLRSGFPVDPPAAERAAALQELLASLSAARDVLEHADRATELLTPLRAAELTDSDILTYLVAHGLRQPALDRVARDLSRA